MNQFEESYLRIPEAYSGRMPFYLTYPMTNVYQTEKEYERDMERMKELYPKRMKKLLAYVEEECDKMEYEGSMMYDEYPDKCSIGALTSSMLRVLQNEEEDPPTEGMIQVLRCNEIYKRRHGGRRGRYERIF